MIYSNIIYPLEIKHLLKNLSSLLPVICTSKIWSAYSFSTPNEELSAGGGFMIFVLMMFYLKFYKCSLRKMNISSIQVIIYVVYSIRLLRIFKSSFKLSYCSRPSSLCSFFSSWPLRFSRWEETSRNRKSSLSWSRFFSRIDWQSWELFISIWSMTYWNANLVMFAGRTSENVHSWTRQHKYTLKGLMANELCN